MFVTFDETDYHIEKNNTTISILDRTRSRVSYTDNAGLSLAP